MSASVLSRTISSATDKKIVLSNDQIIRKIAIGSTWNTLRIAFRIAIDPRGSTSNISVPLFVAGLCSGTSAGFGSQTTTNFIGVGTSNTASNYNLGYFANAGAPYYRMSQATNPASAFGPLTKVSGTLTWPTGGQVTAISANPLVRTPVVIEITKGSPNYSVRWLYVNGTNLAASTIDCTYSELLELLEAGTPARTNFTWATAVATAANETPGSFDSINFSWNQTGRVLELSEVLYCRTA